MFITGFTTGWRSKVFYEFLEVFDEMPVRGNFGAKTLPLSTDDLAVNKMENDDTSIEFSCK